MFLNVFQTAAQKHILTLIHQASSFIHALLFARIATSKQRIPCTMLSFWFAALPLLTCTTLSPSTSGWVPSSCMSGRLCIRSLPQSLGRLLVLACWWAMACGLSPAASWLSLARRHPSAWASMELPGAASCPTASVSGWAVQSRHLEAVSHHWLVDHTCRCVTSRTVTVQSWPASWA